MNRMRVQACGLFLRDAMARPCRVPAFARFQPRMAPSLLKTCSPFEGAELNEAKLKQNIERSVMMVTALSPVIGYDKASKIAHYAMDNDLTLKEAALKLGFVSEAEFDRVVDPRKMVKPYVAGSAAG